MLPLAYLLVIPLGASKNRQTKTKKRKKMSCCFIIWFFPHMVTREKKSEVFLK